MILIAGGTGRLGTVVVAALTARGEPVRVLTRDASRAAPLAGPLVEFAVGDVRRPLSLGPAFAGVRTVVSLVHGFAGPGRVTPASVDRDGNAHLVAAARAAGADVVMASVVGAAADHALELFRMKAAAEENVRTSGVPWTIVRASAFVELYLELMRRSAAKTGRPLVFGRGTTPINFASVTAVAQAVVLAVLDQGQRGRVIDVIGRENVTMNQLAALVSGELGAGATRVRHVPRAGLRVLAASRFVVNSPPSRLAHAALHMDTIDTTATANLTRAAPPGTAGDSA